MIKYIILILFIIVSIFIFINPIIIRIPFTQSNDIILDKYVITLGKKERIDNIKKQEAKINDRITRFNAVNGIKLDINNLIKKNILDKNYNLSKKINEVKRQIGCYLSHLNIYKKIKKENKKGYTIIFEDDFILDSSNFINDTKKIIHTLNNKNIDFDFLYLGNTRNNYGNHITENIYYVNPNQYLFGTYGYIVNNKNIDKIITKLDKIISPIDVIIQNLTYNKLLNTIVIYPNIVNYNKLFESTINTKDST